MGVTRGILGDAARQHCCRAECFYNVERVRYWLDRLLAYEAAGELVGQFFAAAALDRYGATPGDGETASIDIGRVVQQLRARGEPITAEGVAQALCPWSASDGSET